MDYRDILLISASIIALSSFDARAEEGDATAGATVFKKCAICHIVDTDKNKVGPSLNGLFSRRAGTHPDFAYSVGMKAAGDGGLVWDETTWLVLLFHLLSPWWWTPIASVLFHWSYIDNTIIITFWITGAVFVAVVLFMAYCVWRFRHAGQPGRL
jgi:cytochrome c551/c552